MSRVPQRKTVTKSTTIEKDGVNVQLTAQVKPQAVKSGARSTRLSNNKARQAVTEVLDDADELVKDSALGFVSFIREHAIVGLAVGFIIGTQAQAVIKQLVTSFIEPGLKLLTGGNLASRSFHLGAPGAKGADFTWGAMVYALINLIAVLVVVYALIKIFKLDQLDKPKSA